MAAEHRVKPFEILDEGLCCTGILNVQMEKEVLMVLSLWGWRQIGPSSIF
jgi:hypothetical protein